MRYIKLGKKIERGIGGDKRWPMQRKNTRPGKVMTDDSLNMYHLSKMLSSLLSWPAFIYFNLS